MDVNITVALIGLTGISLGALFSGLGYFIRVRAEQKKNKKNVLFHLLEIRHLIRSEYADPDELLRKYTEYFKNYLIRKGVSEDNANAPPEIIELLRAHFRNTALSLKPKIDPAFLTSFEKSINSLSYDTPVLAYRLKGRDRINEFLEVQNNYLVEFEKVMDGGEDVLASSAERQIRNLHYENVENLLKDFDKDIKLISWRCGILTRFGLRKLLQDTKKPEMKIDAVEMDRIMDGFFSELIKNINEAKAAGQLQSISK